MTGKRRARNRIDWLQTQRTLRNATLLFLAAAAGLLGACSDASIGVVDSSPTRRVYVELRGPRSQLGAYRYYDGVRLLECDVQVEAWADGGSNGSSAEWLDGRIDLVDLRTGRYLGSEYLYPGDMSRLWGSREIENGERRFARPLRYSSYGPFRAYFLFRYRAQGLEDEAEHVTDCR